MSSKPEVSMVNGNPVSVNTNCAMATVVYGLRTGAALYAMTGAVGSGTHRVAWSGTPRVAWSGTPWLGTPVLHGSVHHGSVHQSCMARYSPAWLGTVLHGSVQHSWLGTALMARYSTHGSVQHSMARCTRPWPDVPVHGQMYPS